MGCQQSKIDYFRVSILHVDGSTEGVREPAEFFTRKWIKETLGTDQYQALLIDQTWELIFGTWSRFINANASELVKSSIYGRAIVVPKKLKMIDNTFRLVSFDR